MPLRPLRTVHVSTREALDAALRSADRVVVDGDEALLSYAVAKTAGDPENHVDLEMPTAPLPAAAPSFNAPLHSFVAPEAPIPSGFENDFAPMPMARTAPAPALSPRARSPLWIIVAAAVLIAALAAGVLVLGSHPAGVPLTGQSQVAPAPPPAALTAIQPPAAARPSRDLAPAPPPPKVDPGLPKAAEPPAPSSTNEAGVIQAVAWPAVAIIAILALALIARQAIAGGRNVEISWKVTEKVSGRVIITKVKTPSSRRTAPA